MPGARSRNFFDTGYQPVLKAVAARDQAKAAGLRRHVGLRIGRDRLAQAGRAQGHRRDRHLRAERPACRDRHRRGQGRQDGAVREAARPHRRGRRCRWCEAVEKAGVANMVWYNYRRIPAVTLIKQMVDAGQARQDLPLPRQLPAGLDDLARRAAGRRRHLAARRRGRGLRRHRRSPRALHRHRDLDQRLDRAASPR